MSRTKIQDEVRITGAIPDDIHPLGQETGEIHSNMQFDTEEAREPNSLGVIDRMMRPDHFLNSLAGAAADREDILISDVNSLNLRWRGPTHDGMPGTFVIAPDPKTFTKGTRLREWFDEYKEMPLDKTGYRSACRQIDRTTKVFEKFEHPVNRFLDEFHDYFRGSSKRGLMIRSKTSGNGEAGRVVDAVCPQSFNPISNYELMAACMNRITEAHGNVLRGVQVLHDDNAENVSYRVLFGNPVMQELDADADPKKILLLMLSFMGTEHGLSETTFDLGLWRLVCANGAMRSDLKFCHAGWKRFDSETKFLKRVGGLINMAGTYGDVMSERLGRLQHEKLTENPYALLEGLREQRLLDVRTIDTAVLGVQDKEPETNWDMLNILTDSAKTHASMKRRSTAETKALMLAMQPNGFNGVAISGLDRRAAAGDLRRELASAMSAHKDN